MAFVWSKRSYFLQAALLVSEQGCCLRLTCVHTCDLAHDVCNVCLALADSGIPFDFIVATVVAACAGAVSVCVSAGGSSTMSATAGSLPFLLVFLTRVMIVVVIVDSQRDEEEGQRSSCYQ